MQIHSDEVHEEELEAPKFKDIVMEERSLEEHDDHDMTKPQILVDPPKDVNTYKKRPTWA